jgi:hypothetical protein
MARARITRNRRTRTTDETSGRWNVYHPAVWWERVHGEDRAITLRHPTYPFVETSPGDEEDLKRIAAQYLRKVAPAFGLPSLFKDTGSSFGVRLSWLDLDEKTVPAPPRASVWLRRDDVPPSGRPLDRTLVFLVVQSLEANTPQRALGSRLGIRIVAHLSRRRGRRWEVRITSSACSRGLAPEFDVRSTQVTVFLKGFFSEKGFVELQRRIRTAANLDDDAPVRIDGVRGGSATELELYANFPRREDRPQELASAMTFSVRVLETPGPTPELVLIPIERHVLAANLADVEAQMFLQDPASKAGIGHLVDARPSRAPDRLEKYRERVTLPDLTPDRQGYKLSDGLGQVQITRSRLVDPTADEKETQVEQPGTVPNARTNSFAAVSGYQHARELFDAMRNYGLRPTEYFKLASPPLRVRYRATIQPGPGKDGKTINAQVDYDPPDGHLVLAVWNPTWLKPLQVRFALADLRRSASRREPLGLATDRRWSWHEYSHVLLAASTGALELRFVHSVGDALAAITSDPESALTRPLPAAVASRPAIHRRMRWLTFPWVYVNRRHDRSVFYGWSWCGRYHRPAQFKSGGSHGPRKGYQSEQILSTSLFRFYRATGGDTSVDLEGTPDVAARRRASDYAVYVILRAIGSLGPAAWVPIETPDQLVSALVDADVATMPASRGLLAGRAGGCVHKVIRWAFEAQGLYATTDPLAVVDAPGNPPPVDVFIDDRRPDAAGTDRRGGYVPVSLDWGVTVDPPPWHATRAAIRVSDGRVRVEVRNRGALDATGVDVSVWYAQWRMTAPAPPAWNTPNAWKKLGPQRLKTVPAWPAPAVTFGPYRGLPAPAPGHALVVVAVATCPGDRANVDRATLLPCSTEPTPIVDLVAGDNNMGLIVVRRGRNLARSLPRS